ncbi:MAG: GAF domain-containing protein [Elusimicrobia bacterium]|nr:GAF domain-containing protein [Elusimicrobiota bacterium]
MNTPLRISFLEALYDIMDFVQGLRDADEDKVFGRLVEKLSVVMEAEAATYYSYLPSKRQLFPSYVLGSAAREVAGTGVDIRTGICGWVATHREPLIIEDAYKDKRFLREVDSVTGFKTRSVLAVPLCDRLELLGVIQLLNKRNGVFTSEDLRFVRAACELANSALRLLRLESTMDKVASRNASILESLSGGFIAIDTHGRIMLMNPAARRILALPADLPLSTPVEQALMHAPKVADILLDTLASRKTVKRQELGWTHQEQSRTLGYSTILIQDPQGEITGAGITFQDLTNVKK